MKKANYILTLMAVAIFAFMPNLSNAQSEGFSVGPNIDIGMPLGDFGDISTFGVGFRGTGQYNFNENFAVMASLGYMSFIGKKYHGYKYDNTGAVTFRVGAKYYFSDGGFFAQGELGQASMSNHFGSAFLFSPGIGARFGELEIALKYEIWAQNATYYSHFGSLSHVGVSVGYYFDL